MPLPNQSAAPSNVGFCNLRSHEKPENINQYLENMTSAQLYDMVAKMKVLLLLI
jgi:hypothetical protein